MRNTKGNPLEENRTYEEARRLAEAHWQYTEMLLRWSFPVERLEQFHGLYIAAFIHGIKHGEEGKE